MGANIHIGETDVVTATQTFVTSGPWSSLYSDKATSSSFVERELLYLSNSLFFFFLYFLGYHVLLFFSVRLASALYATKLIHYIYLFIYLSIYKIKKEIERESSYVLYSDWGNDIRLDLRHETATRLHISTSVNMADLFGWPFTVSSSSFLLYRRRVFGLGGEP